MFSGKLTDSITITPFPYLPPAMNFATYQHLQNLLHSESVQKHLDDFKANPTVRRAKMFLASEGKITFLKLKDRQTSKQSIFLKTQLLLGKGACGKVTVMIAINENKLWAVKSAALSDDIDLGHANQEFYALDALNRTTGSLLKRCKDQRKKKMYISMTLERGEDLRCNASVLKKMTRVQWLQLMIDILIEIDNLHNRFLHCDIKPDNMILDDEGKIKLIDFGDAEEGQTFKKDLLIYTMNFKAPELSKSNPVYNEQTEMYAAGETIRFLLRFNPHKDLSKKIGPYLPNMQHDDPTKRVNFKEAIAHFQQLQKAYPEQLDKFRKIAVITHDEFVNCAPSDFENFTKKAKLLDEIWMLDMRERDEAYYLQLNAQFQKSDLPVPTKLIHPNNPNLSVAAILSAIPKLTEREHVAYFYLTSSSMPMDLQLALEEQGVKILAGATPPKVSAAINDYLGTRILPIEQLKIIKAIISHELMKVNAEQPICQKSQAFLSTYLSNLESKKDFDREDLTALWSAIMNPSVIPDANRATRILVAMKNVQASMDHYTPLKTPENFLTSLFK